MAQKVSISKGFSSPLFDTYVPELDDAADITNALKLFYFGNSSNGNDLGNFSLYQNLIDFDDKIAEASSQVTSHGSTIVDIHGVGVGSEVVGTVKTQTLTNKTLTSPKINENVAITVTSTQINNSVNPVGTIVMFGGANAPTGWLLCNGQSTAGYSALAAVVGANVPDLRGRAPIGYGTSVDANITARGTIAAKVGAETHTLSIAEMPNHTHPGQIVFGAGSGTGGVVPTGIGNYQPSTGNTGGDAPHNNMQPSTVVNFIIKF
jgi:microcystin-dependent protein